jgi:tungstate transport system ATP-binding protein
MVRAPTADLPIIFDDVCIAAVVTILDRITLTLSPGTPTGIDRSEWLGENYTAADGDGLTTPSHGRMTWGGREDVPPTRRAILFQRPAMLRRSAGGNVRFALRAAGIPRLERHRGSSYCCGMAGSKSIAYRPLTRFVFPFVFDLQNEEFYFFFNLLAR